MDITLSYIVRVLVYIAVVAMLLILVHLIFKYVVDSHNEEAVEVQFTSSETTRLLPKDTIPFKYGTCEGDLERGNIGSGSSSSDDLYDGKICIICYDDQRNCFFVPCGHSATCYVCAKRIFYGENKTCPVCRRFLHRVRKLFASYNRISK